MNRLLNRQRMDAQIEITRLNSRPSVRLPLSLNETLEQMRDILDQMAEEAPGPVRHEAAAHALGLQYIATSSGASIAMNTHCALGGLSVSGSPIYYVPLIQIGAGTNLPPDGQPVMKLDGGVTDEEGRMTEMGRMGGTFGWSKDRNLIAGALASYVHNWVGLLALYRERPKLPQTQPWVLPNMTLAETVAPKQLVMPATYTYRLMRPALKTKYVVEVSSDTPVSLGFDWWDATKNDVTRLNQVNVGAGDNQIVLSARVPMSGIFTINPLDAPKGLTIKSAYTIPRAI